MISTRSNILIGTWIVLASLGGCGTPPRDGSEKISPTTNDVAGPAGLTLTALVYEARVPTRSGSSLTVAELTRALDEAGNSLATSIVESWKADGIRIAIADAARLRAVISELQPTRPTQRLQFGEMLNPTPLFSGIMSDHELRLERGEEILTVPGGALRLLARCYVIPGSLRTDATPESQLRIDLSVQHFDPALVNVTPDNSFEVVRERRPEEQGGILGSLSFSADLPRGMGLIISCIEQEDRVDDATISGPAIPKFLRLGEALLTDFTTIPQSRLRTVILIEPQGVE